MKHRLRYYGDPILRKKAKPVKAITPDVLELIADMITIMKETNGIGIAAPQVGVSLRIFVSIVQEEAEDGTLIFTDPYVCINPEISNLSIDTDEMDEGCLSLPNLTIPVIRSIELDLKAFDINNKPFEMKCRNFLARHVLHEFDHLEGVLTIDHLKGKKRTALEPELRLIKKKYHSESTE